MLSKLIIISLFGTGVVGTSAVSGMTPIGMEFAAGPIRIESGNGNGFNAHLDTHAPLSLKIDLKDQRSLTINF